MKSRIIYPVSLAIIQDEHQHLASVMQGMLYFVRGIEKGGRSPDLKVFRAMLYYIAEYPNKVHHPKEETYLFSKLRDRTHQLDPDLDILCDQHQQGEALLAQLKDALADLEFIGLTTFNRFRDLVERYCAFYFEHMRIEETRILPIAKQILSDQDWRIIDAAFMKNRFALDDTGERYRYDQLFALIISIAPAPIGMGEPLHQ